MKRTLRIFSLLIVIAVTLVGGVAVAQHLPAPERPASVPGDGHGRPRPLQRLDPDGKPLRRPGTRPGHSLPPGFEPRGARPHAGHAPAAQHESGEHGGGGEHACAGHGPEDPPHAPNLWHGLLMVNNEAAEKGGFLNRLLFRYENTTNPCDEKNEPPPILANLLNFGVLVFILFRFGKKPIAEVLARRKESIMAEIETATRLKRDAEGRLVDCQERIDNIAATLKKVRAEYAEQAEREKQHVLAEAEERRTRMLKDAELRVEQEIKEARAGLLRETVEKALTAAEGLLAKQVSANDLDRMANDYLKTVGTSLSEARG